ncbi:MAG TPA: hypothetical protein VNO22_00330 [Planctomycetota bacterium]|nr:hypothetical protein [Planctomycetota bacterium]
MKTTLLAFLGVLGAGAAAAAQVGDPQLETDDPYYPGEGAMSTPSRAVAHALRVPRGALGNTSPRDKLIRLFLWRAEHYAHLTSPAVYNLPGVKPDPSADHPLMTDYDAMRALFSYAWGLCGTNHAQMRPFVEALGWTDRRRALVGDTGYEVHVDGGWRYVNTDQYTLHFLANDPAAHFASLDQVIGTNHHYIEWNPDLGMGYRLPQANTHGGYQDFNGVTGLVPNRSLQWRDYYQNVWKPITTGAGNYKMYGEGYTATPVTCRLKRGETFTRWLSPTGVVTDLGLPGLLWWGYNSGDLGAGDNGPYAEWSFVQNAPARDEVPGGPEESRGRQRWGNACFDWQPSLAAGEHLDGAAAVTGTLATGGTPALRSTGASSLVLEHYSPYTIAARPTDGRDPANAATDGAVLSASAVGTIGVEISVNAGASWTSAGTLSGPSARLDFTDLVKGRNGYLVRLSFDDGEGLDSLRLRTITMLSQAVYPNLKNGTAQVTYSSGRSGAIDLSPDLWSAATADSTTGYVRKVGDSGNLSALYYSGGTMAYQSTNNQPISITCRISLPPQRSAAGATLRTIHAAANYQIRVPPPAGAYGKIEIAPDAAGPWTQIAFYAPPSDNELSSYWAYGSSGPTALGGTSYYVRFTTYNGGYTSGIRFLRLYATFAEPATSSPLIVTYHWNNGAERSHTYTVPAGSARESWTISTGSSVVQRKVVLQVPSQAAAADGDGDGMSNAFEATHGFDAAVADQDANGRLDGQDDWDGDGLANAADSTPGTPPAGSAGADGDRSGGGGCGALGLEALLALLLGNRRGGGPSRFQRAGSK